MEQQGNDFQTALKVQELAQAMAAELIAKQKQAEAELAANVFSLGMGSDAPMGPANAA